MHKDFTCLSIFHFGSSKHTVHNHKPCFDRNQNCLPRAGLRSAAPTLFSDQQSLRDPTLRPTRGGTTGGFACLRFEWVMSHVVS